ncbi:unnamed protein product [Closterium sp. NIES-53]
MSSNWPLLAAAGVGVFAVGCFCGHLISSSRWRRALLELQAWHEENAGGAGGKNSGKGGKGGALLELDSMAREFEDFKMVRVPCVCRARVPCAFRAWETAGCHIVLVVRSDLKMGKGKIGAQCGHATLGLYKRLAKRAPTALQRWDENGQVKVVVKVDSEEELIILQIMYEIPSSDGGGGGVVGPTSKSCGCERACPCPHPCIFPFPWACARPRPCPFNDVRPLARAAAAAAAAAASTAASAPPPPNRLCGLSLISARDWPRRMERLEGRTPGNVISRSSFLPIALDEVL